MQPDERQQVRLALAALFMAARIARGTSSEPQHALHLADELLALVRM